MIRKFRVMLVEDSLPDIYMIRSIFRELDGLEDLQVIRDGAAALKTLRTADRLPDIILLDLNLPKVSGFELLEAVQEHPEIHQIPVVVLTSSEAERDVLQSFRLKVAGYMVKPPSRMELSDIIEQIQRYWLRTSRIPLSA